MSVIKALYLIDFLNNSDINKWYKFIQNTQFWNKSEIENYQNEKLTMLIRHAYKNVPYYNNLFKKLNLQPSEISSPADLIKIPILTREVVRQNYKDLLAGNHYQFNSQKRHTGGTTGTPLEYYSDKTSWDLHWALKYRAWEWGGYSLGDRIAIMGGSSIIPGKVSLKRKAWNKLNNFYILSASHLSSEMMKNYASIIKKNKIKFLRGYPSSIAHFAKFCLENKQLIELKSVITTAEVLQKQYKEMIKSAFDCSIIDTYGCADGGGNANTCNHDCGFHVSFEASIWEVSDQSGNQVPQGQPGDLLLTSLTNYAMPMIRYQPGDVIENCFDYTVCSCGRSLPRIKEIIGRKTDLLSFSNGITLGGPALTILFSHFSLLNYQIVQTSSESVKINIVPGNNFTYEQQKKMLDIMAYHCGPEINISLEEMNEVPLPKSGKHRFILNNTI